MKIQPKDYKGCLRGQPMLVDAKTAIDAYQKFKDAIEQQDKMDDMLASFVRQNTKQ